MESRFRVLVCRSQNDPHEQNTARSSRSLTHKLPHCEGPLRPKFYANSANWEWVLRTVQEVCDLWGDKPINNYQAKEDMAERVRDRLNIRANRLVRGM